jgi:RND family efflux transporter MFP subunit
MEMKSTAMHSKGPVIGASVLLVLALAAAYEGIATRAKALSDVTKETQQQAVPVVAVVQPTLGAPQEDIALPGTMQAFIDAPIFARTNGYLRKWYADIGTHVQAGQLLADIDAPELEQQLQQARADEANAEANERLAQTTATRYRDLIKTESIAQQDLDNANGNLEARQAAVLSARANVKRLEQLHGFTHIEAPFDGVITARNTDVGALIDSGSNAHELFHIADTRRLRVFVNVPEVYSRSARPGITADLTLKEFPGRRFTGRLARTSQAIDVASRTLLTEIDVDNPKGELLAGSYCEAHLELPQAAATLKLPASALIFKTDVLQVAVVDAAHRVTLKTVQIGRDFGNTVEIVNGLGAHDSVIENPPDSLASGQTVRVVSSGEGRP